MGFDTTDIADGPCSAERRADAVLGEIARLGVDRGRTGNGPCPGGAEYATAPELLRGRCAGGS